MSEWKNRSIVVTGANRGIGASLTREWLLRGATVYAHARMNSSHSRSQFLKIADGAEGTLIPWFADASVKNELGTAFATLISSVEPFDAVLFNHGTTVFEDDNSTVRIAPPSSYSAKELSDLLQINALSIWEALNVIGKSWANVEQRAINVLRRRSIVLLSSSGAVNPNVFDPLPYKISKAMLLHFVRDLTVEFGRYNISINAVSPGMMDAGLAHLPFIESMKEEIVKGIPMERYGAVSELFTVINTFLSGDASFASGNNITVNGGAYALST